MRIAESVNRRLLQCGLLSLAAVAALPAQEKPHFTTVAPMVRPGVTVNVVNAPGAGVQRPATAAQSAQKAHVEPGTGRIKQPDAEESTKLSEEVKAMIGQAQVNLQPVYHQNGMVSVDLQGSFLEFATAVISKDGKLMLSCESSGGKSIEAAGAAISKAPKTEVIDVR